MKNRFLLILVIFLVLPNVLFSQSEEDLASSLLAEPETKAIEAYLLEKTDSDNYQELENQFLGRAKELVLSNEYKPAFQILEALLSVDLDNLEVQEIYIAVGKMIKEEEAAELAQAEPETVQEQAVETEVSGAEKPEQGSEQDTAEVAETDEPQAGALTADQIAQAVAQAVADAMAQGGEIRAGDGEPGETKTTGTTSAGESGIEGDIRTAEDTSTGFLQDIVDWSLHFGAGDLLLYGSQFYTDFYDESQLFLSYGLSLDFEAILKLNKLNLSGEVSFDAFFADFVPLSGTEVSYKLMLGAALPNVIPVPLYARLGFGQLWYLFGDETPNRLITAVPSPLLGIKLNGLKLGTLFSMDSSIDYYLITFFTSYIASAFDISVALEINLPIKSALAFTTRVEVLPTVMIGSGGGETSAKLKISFGIGNKENE